MAISTIGSAGINQAADTTLCTTSGNVGIGTSSPAYLVDIGSSSGTGDLASVGLRIRRSGVSNDWSLIDNVAGAMNFRQYDSTTPIIRWFNSTDGSNWTERMRIDSSGNLLAGVTSTVSNARFVSKSSTSSSSDQAFQFQNSNGSVLLTCRADGYLISLPVYNQTSGSAANVFVNVDGGLYRSTSSIKYKTNVQNASHGLAEVMQLRPVTYRGKSEVDSGKTFGGLIAEEVHAAGLTEFVQYAEDGTPDALAYGQMVSLAFKAIQEQQALITQLQADVAGLKGTA